MNYYFSQSVYGGDSYGSSLYSADQTSTQTQQQTGLIDTGSPVFWGSVIGITIIIVVIITLMPFGRKHKKKKDSK